MATLKDIAKSLNLSVSTVSRSINDHPSISQKTKDLVNAEIKRLNYSPNSFAKSLSDNKSYTITLFVDIDDEQSFQNPFFYEIMHGIEKYVYRHEYNLIIANTKTKIRKQSVIEWLINSKRTDGVILPSTVVDDELISLLKERNIPFVSLGQPTGVKHPVSWSDIDNFGGTEQATNYLLNQNRQNIAFIGYDEEKLFSVKRLEGFRQAYKTSGKVINEKLIISCDHTKDDGYEYTKQLISNHNIDAIICADDNLSFGAIKALNELNITIPDQVSLISFDNEYTAKLSYPEITTIKVDVFELGYQSAKLLFNQIETSVNKTQGVLISTEMNFRQTTK